MGAQRAPKVLLLIDLRVPASRRASRDSHAQCVCALCSLALADCLRLAPGCQRARAQDANFKLNRVGVRQEVRCAAARCCAADVPLLPLCRVQTGVHVSLIQCWTLLQRRSARADHRSSWLRAERQCHTLTEKQRQSKRVGCTHDQGQGEDGEVMTNLESDRCPYILGFKGPAVRTAFSRHALVH